jgi:hypothetical protein
MHALAQARFDERAVHCLAMQPQDRSAGRVGMSPLHRKRSTRSKINQGRHAAAGTL